MTSKTHKLFIVSFILFCLNTFLMNAQTVVMDKDDNFPVSFASVFNQDGKFLGQTDVDGRLPELGDSKSIRITHIAYEPAKAKVSGLGKELKIKPVPMKLGEAVIATPKTYCIRLTGFLRNFSFSNQLYEDDDPVLRFFEGTGQLYLFLDGKKSNQWVDRVVYDRQLDKMVEKQKRVNLGLKAKSIFERINKSEKTELRNADGYQQIVSKDTVIGTVVTDSLNHLTRVDLDHLFPDTMKMLNMVVIKLRVTNYKEHFIYQQVSDGYVSQSTLRGYQSYIRAWTKMLGKRVDLDSFDEFYVDKAECLTQEQYKEAMKEEKARKKEPGPEVTKDVIEKYIADHNIPDIPEEILKVLETSRQIQADKEAKKAEKEAQKAAKKAKKK